MDQARSGDHICYYSDLRKMKAHYPRWRLTRSLPQIFEEIVASWRERMSAKVKMRILITGICGFVGSTLARGLREGWPDWEIVGLDNFVRAGSETNRRALRERGVKLFHGDVRNPSDLEALPRCDWIIEAAANPSVLAGVDGKTSSRQLIEHNLVGTINMLELLKQWRCGFTILSTSRVYSIRALAAIPVEAQGDRFVPTRRATQRFRASAPQGVAEDFSTEPPLSLYGSSKRASELLACEYAESFDLPVFVLRCGVLAGAGQFGKIDQGIFSYWIHSWLPEAAAEVHRLQRHGPPGARLPARPRLAAAGRAADHRSRARMRRACSTSAAAWARALRCGN